jgi:predicted tellurium resistance membrane protein TerC
LRKGRFTDTWTRIAWHGAAEGAAGGVLFGLVYWAAVLRSYPADPRFAEYAAVYAAACIAWGVGYAYLATTQPQVNRFPVLSGLSFGVVVYVVAQLILYGIAAEQIHTAQQVAFGMSATCLFFGLPVALISRLFERTR